MMGELSRIVRRALSIHLPTPTKHARAGLVYPFDPAVAMLALSHQRTVTRVLWERYKSQATRLEPLYEQLRADIEDDTCTWCWDGAGISVRARNVDSFAAGERQIVGTVKNALIDGAAFHGNTLRVQPRNPDILIDVRMHDDTLTVSVDLGGRSLSRRGYRERQGTAPLREHLAAVLCMLARHDARSEVLFDPMCGSGTICIEAALMGTARPVHAMAVSPLRALPCFRDITPIEEPLFADTRPVVIGSEIDRHAYRAAVDNAQRACVRDDVVFKCRDFRDISRADVEMWATSKQWDGAGGVIVCNPPYGHRVDDPTNEGDVVRLYRDLSDWCTDFKGWRAAFLVANEQWSAAFGRRYRVRKSIKNGPLDSIFYLYDL